MNFLSWCLLLLIALWVVLALGYVIRNKGGCACGGGKKRCSSNGKHGCNSCGCKSGCHSNPNNSG